MQLTLSSAELNAGATAPDGSRTILDRKQLNIYVLVNCGAFVGLLCAVLFYTRVDYWLPAVLSMVVYSAAVVYLANSLFSAALEEAIRLRYQVKISDQLIAQLETQVIELGQLDALTGCANRSRFDEQLRRHFALSIRSGNPFAIIRLRLDRYPEYLSQYGQRIANDLLKVFSSVLRSAMREVDVAARFDDEHFAVMLADTDIEGAIVVARRVQHLTRQLQGANGRGRVTLLIGVAEYHQTERSDQFVAEAEVALNHAVDQGGDRIAGYNHSAVALSGTENTSGLPSLAMG